MCFFPSLHLIIVVIIIIIIGCRQRTHHHCSHLLLLLNSRVTSSPHVRIEEGGGHVERKGLVCRPVNVKD